MTDTTANQPAAAAEAADRTNSTTIRERDVLLGRGGATNKHQGNKEYRKIVTEHQQEYLAAKKKEKVVIARRIVSIVQQNGGRFLKQVGDNWEAVTDKRAQEKTSQALREGLDVRNKMIRAGKAPRRDSGSSAATPPRKRAKKTSEQQQTPNSPVPPSMVSVDGNTNDVPTGGPGAFASAPAPISFLTYQPQLSNSDVTDVCAL